MTAVPPVEKLGSLWKGQVTSVNAAGALITNFLTEDVAPLAQKSKVWFDLGLDSTTVRGLLPSAAEAPSGRLSAVQGANGFVELVMPGANAAQTTGLAAGAPVLVNFRT